MILAAALVFQTASIQEDSRPYPSLVTTATRKDPAALAELEKPGTVIFTDGFETADSLESYFEIRGREEGNAVLTTDSAIAHRGKGAFRFTAKANGGKSSGSGANYWFGAKGGYDRVYLRWYEELAPDYDQGNLNHTGAGISGVVGENKWGWNGRRREAAQGRRQPIKPIRTVVRLASPPASGLLILLCVLDGHADRQRW